MKNVIHPDFQNHSEAIKQTIAGFEKNGTMFDDGKRNKIKLFPLAGLTINVKSFKIPHLVNRLVYRYFRDSKAKRSYEFAVKLLEMGVGTPQPIAYFENFTATGLRDSYYVSEQLQADCTFRELTQNPDYPNHEEVLRQFTQFTFGLHEKGIEFLDHTPGNTLIQKMSADEYKFSLVDLNRMRFHQNLSFEQRMINMARLTPKLELLDIMSDEYAKLYGKSKEAVFTLLNQHAQEFKNRFVRKKRLKKQLQFWK